MNGEKRGPAADNCFFFFLINNAAPENREEVSESEDGNLGRRFSPKSTGAGAEGLSAMLSWAGCDVRRRPGLAANLSTPV